MDEQCFHKMNNRYNGLIATYYHYHLTIFLLVRYPIYGTISGLPRSPDLLVAVGAALGGLGTPSYID